MGSLFNLRDDVEGPVLFKNTLETKVTLQVKPRCMEITIVLVAEN